MYEFSKNEVKMKVLIVYDSKDGNIPLSIESHICGLFSPQHYN